MISDRRLIEDFIPIGKFLPRQHGKSLFAKVTFQRCIYGGRDDLSSSDGRFCVTGSSRNLSEANLFEDND